VPDKTRAQQPRIRGFTFSPGSRKGKSLIYSLLIGAELVPKTMYGQEEPVELDERKVNVSAFTSNGDNVSECVDPGNVQLEITRDEDGRVTRIHLDVTIPQQAKKGGE